MPRSRLLTIYTLLFAFALGAGMLVANYFGSSDVLPTGAAPLAGGTSLATEMAPTSTDTAPTRAATSNSAPTPTASPGAAATTPATEIPTSEPPTLVPEPEPPTATSEQPTTAPEASYIEYTVESGDTLKSIAETYGVTVGDILANNQIENPDSLTIGTVLRIPKV